MVVNFLTRTWNMVKRILFTLALPIALALSSAGARNVRIVDFGSDLGSGELMYRGIPPERGMAYDPAMGGDSRHSTGKTFVSAWPFRADEPLNPPGLRYGTYQKNAVFYGGLVTLTINNPQRALSEGHPNANHEFRDDLNFMALYGGAFKPGEEIEAYAFWFWKKPDFLNGGAALPVSFDADSRISVHISRYWGGVHAGRWVVQDGADFFVSEKTFGDVYRQFTFEDKENPIIRRTHTLAPTETRWAKWEPKEPCGLAFDHRTAEFVSHDFRDVSAVGFLVTRELSPAVKAVPGGLSPNQPIAVKWYAFRCDAVVGSGDKPSDFVSMIDAGGLSVGRSEVTFAEWERVRKIAVTNQYPRDLGELGYTFSSDGSMGSMRIGDQSHQAGEPVTDITWLDAAAWCNALSEIEGLEPAYYTDAGHSAVFRRVYDRDQEGAVSPSVFWKSDAAGYRLPTSAEWKAAASTGGGFSTNPPATGTGTLPVGTLQPGPGGLVGMNGNVWEYVWPENSTPVDPTALSAIEVLGGAFAGSENPQLENPGFGIETPFESGAFNIGFRVVRGKKQELPDTASVPEWKIPHGLQIPPGANGDPGALRAFAEAHLPLISVPGAGIASVDDFMDPLDISERNRKRAKALNEKFLGNSEDAPEPELEIVRAPYTLLLGQTEVPYSVWNRVRAWAKSNGYVFNYAGDMGSMRIATDPSAEFSPEEPVTFISWYDAVAWCNALSELSGLKPVYFTDAGKTHPFRQVSPFRLETYRGAGYPNPVWKKNSKAGEQPDTALRDLIFFDVFQGGYRLPLYDEFRAADAAGTSAGEWTGATSGGRTHPVGSLPAGSAGLQDMGGNVLEWGWDDKAPHMNSMVDYRINGDGYFFENPAPPKANKAYFKEYTGAARPFVGFRIARGQPE